MNLLVPRAKFTGPARARNLRPKEYSGGTFAISNPGMYDVVGFTAVIDPAHDAILPVGAIENTPAAVNGQVAVRHRTRLTGAFDHRIIGGPMGARFLQKLKKILEQPVLSECATGIPGLHAVCVGKSDISKQESR